MDNPVWHTEAQEPSSTRETIAGVFQAHEIEFKDALLIESYAPLGILSPALSAQ